jgi:hypothetical protein
MKGGRIGSSRSRGTKKRKGGEGRDLDRIYEVRSGKREWASRKDRKERKGGGDFDRIYRMVCPN